MPGSDPTRTSSELLLENAPCGFAVLDITGKILFSNRALGQMLGRSTASLEKTCFQDLLSAAGKLFYETQFAPTLLLRGRVNEISLDLAGPDGIRVPVFVNANLQTGTEERDRYMLLAVFPAQQRRLYEKELLRARKEFEQVAEVVRRSSDAILRLNPEGVIETWNNGAEHIFGFSGSEAIGKPVADLFVPGGAEALSPAVAKLRGGSEAALEIGGVHKDGKRLELSVNLTPHMEAPGVLVGFSAILRDITSRKLAERALMQNEKLASVGRLASSIAHEINNPLESVTNLLYILGSRVEGETRDLVMTAEQELARVSHIVTHTLRFHKQSTSRTEVDLDALTSSVISLYRARLDTAGIRVAQNSTRASSLLCFEGELRQILVNLVSNAYDAMRTGGRLVLRSRDVTHRPSGTKGVRITVADTGSGMDHETLTRLFEPFFSTKGIGGTGLGLWITQDLVQKNEGRIRVRSTNRPGRSGTVFVLFFPHQPSRNDAPPHKPLLVSS